MDEIDKEILRYVKEKVATDNISIARDLGSNAKQRAYVLAADGYLNKEGSTYLATFSLREKGEIALWSFHKRLMHELISNHGWEIIKWFLSFVAGGSAFALVKWILDRFQ